MASSDTKRKTAANEGRVVNVDAEDASPHLSNHGTDAQGGGGEPDTPHAPPAAAAEDSEEVYEVPSALVIECPNCHTAFPYTGDLSGYVPNTSTKFATCIECGGLGEVQTGSLVALYAVRKCPTCDGVGFVETATNAPPAALETFTQQPPWPGAVWDDATQLWK